MINTKGILIGTVAALIVSIAIIVNDRLAEVSAQTTMNPMNPSMGGMSTMPGISGMGTSGVMSMGGGMGGGMMMGGMGGSMGGMHSMGGGGQSRHGQFYSPGTVHQLCQQDVMMGPAYCEPYYQVMSSIPGVKIVHVHPVDNTSLEVTMREIGSAKSGIDQSGTLFVGNNYLYGRADVSGGWSGETKVTVKLSGMGTVYDYESMHAHLFPSGNIPMDHAGR